MQKISTFFMFSENARDAVEFYVSVFPNSKFLSMIPGPDGRPIGGTFQLEGQRFSAFNGGPQFSFSQGISQFVSCDTQDEIDHFYEKLSAGGVAQPCGWLTDKFGNSWQIVPTILGELLGDPDRGKADRVVQAMLKMHKLSIQGLKEAAAG